jgi:hypothetical protein
MVRPSASSLSVLMHQAAEQVASMDPGDPGRLILAGAGQSGGWIRWLQLVDATTSGTAAVSLTCMPAGTQGAEQTTTSSAVAQRSASM